MSRKGSLAGVLPMLAILLLSIVLSVQSLPIAEGLASVMEESSKDISSSAETKSNSENILNNYIKDSMKYSANNAAYSLRKDAIDWKGNATSASDSSEIIEPVLKKWRNRTQKRFTARIEEVDCSVNPSDISVYEGKSAQTLNNTDDIENTNTSLKPKNVSVRCNDIATYRKEDYGPNISAENRFIETVKPTANFFYLVENTNLESPLKNSYTGDGKACKDDSDARSDAENEARKDAVGSYENDAYDLSNIEDQANIAPGISLSYSADHYYTGSFSSHTEGDGCNPGCIKRVDGRCQIYGDRNNYTKVDYNLYPSSMHINATATDTSNEVLVDGIYQNLKTEVTEYIVDYN